MASEAALAPEAPTAADATLLREQLALAHEHLKAAHVVSDRLTQLVAVATQGLLDERHHRQTDPDGAEAAAEELKRLRQRVEPLERELAAAKGLVKRKADSLQHFKRLLERAHAERAALIDRCKAAEGLVVRNANPGDLRTRLEAREAELREARRAADELNKKLASSEPGALTKLSAEHANTVARVGALEADLQDARRAAAELTKMLSDADNATAELELQLAAAKTELEAALEKLAATAATALAAKREAATVCEGLQTALDAADSERALAKEDHLRELSARNARVAELERKLALAEVVAAGTHAKAKVACACCGYDVQEGLAHHTDAEGALVERAQLSSVPGPTLRTKGKRKAPYFLHRAWGDGHITHLTLDDLPSAAAAMASCGKRTRAQAAREMRADLRI